MPAVLLDPIGGVWSEIGRGDISGKINLTFKGLNAQVTIVFDENFVPYIFAANDHDAAFALGYLHATYRLWQMDAQRRLAEGTLSEILGNSTLQQDEYMRIVGLGRAARNTSAWLQANSPEAYSLLESYSDGVNQVIQEDESSHTLPLMFKLLEYSPDSWGVADSIAWSKYMAWSLTDYFNPLVNTKLAIKLGDNDTNILSPVHPYYHDNVTVVPGDGTVNSTSINVDPNRLLSEDWFMPWSTGIDLSNSQVANGLDEAIDSILELSGQQPPGLGSNDWVVSPRRSASGMAMLANDPHLALNLPSIWYEVYIHTPDLDVHGVTLPGIPFVIIGANKHVAWGLTNTETGVLDFYAEKLSVDRSMYFFEGAWRSIQTLDEPIQIKGAKTLDFKVNLTIHGPIISTRGCPVSFKWTGNAGFMNDGSGVTREALTMLMVNKATGYQDLLNALRYWDVPSQNFAFADDDGNFGIITPGLFPYRTVTLPTGDVVRVESARSVLNGTGGFEWEGYIPYSLVPKTINPDRGFTAAPNQMSVGPHYPYFILGGWWDPVGRAQRIFQLLSSKNPLGIQDMMHFQSDTYNWYAAALSAKLLGSLRSNSTFFGCASNDALCRSIINGLATWNFQMNKNDSRPLIWWAWFSALYDLMFKDYFKSHGIGNRYYPYPETVVWLALNEPNSKWFDGDEASMLNQAFGIALQRLRGTYGTSWQNWTWGRLHQLMLTHLSGLDALSYGPVPEDGGPDVLMAAPIPYDLSLLNSSYRVGEGPSWRLVAEMGPSSSVYGVYPGGQTENPVSNHYTDLVNVWLTYNYNKLQFPESPQDVTHPSATIEISPE